MSTSENIIASVFFCSIVASSATGVITTTMSEKITPQEFEKAIELCSNNHGVNYIELDLYNNDVYCSNGALFEIPVQEG